MSATSLDDPQTPTSDAGRPRGWRWWLHVAEVRLRFVVLVAAALVIMGGWDHLRGVWDRMRHTVGRTADAAVTADTEFFCPMDPGVVSAWPAICPICNMDLVQRRKHDAQVLPEGVVARMQISPYRVQLAGIRTSEVTVEPLAYEVPVAGRLEGGDEASPNPRFEAAVSAADVPFLGEPREATVTTADGTATAAAVAKLVTDGGLPRIRIELSEGKDIFVAGLDVRAVIRVPAGETGEAVVTVPESAVVDRGDRRLAFVESMPGQFDAVPVQLGRRCGDRYPVLAGLEPGQKVATAGAFLIDAETRLNPSLAVAYFGANQAGADTASRVPEVRVAKERTEAPKLSPADLALAARQKVCPVTELPLDSMGGPVPVVVEGRKVFICCEGCEDELKANAAKYLTKLPGDD